jgi:hypothetical protein
LDLSAYNLRFNESELIVDWAEGRTISVPLAWYSTLANATHEQLEDYQLLGGGDGIHWPQLDEDLSVKGLLLGTH